MTQPTNHHNPDQSYDSIIDALLEADAARLGAEAEAQAAAPETNHTEDQAPAATETSATSAEVVTTPEVAAASESEVGADSEAASAEPAVAVAPEDAPESVAPSAAADTADVADTAESGAAEADAADVAEDSAEPEGVRFGDLGLAPEVMAAIAHEGFEQPTPIQERAIPVVLSGRDMIGQAQTGTGKTAAFALPILSRLVAGHKRTKYDSRERAIFALVLEPTRELALQVAESFSRFAHFIEDFRVVPIYGGASYEAQLKSLRRGVQVVVATPGRLMDLMERGRLDFSAVEHVVIDEADEMLRMGFIDDVDWILERVTSVHQTALFSATMPEVIRRIATAHLVDPVEVRIESRTTTATTVRQRYWVATGAHKIDAMTRMLEVEPYEAVLVFVRTKTDAEEVANKLAARGFACAALHGDIPQRQREHIVNRLKKGTLDILIATDVAARGLDVDRITHVFNYDIPYDAESYVHRIGRTGRAGRTGEAILFVSPRERRALRQIERVTKQRIEPMSMPTIADVNKRRLENFRNQILDTIENSDLEPYVEVIEEMLTDDSIEPEILCAALAKMAQRDGELLLDESEPEPAFRSFDDKPKSSYEGEGRERRRAGGPSAQPQPLKDFPDLKMVRYRLAVGRRDVVKPGQIVGAIANEANLDSKYIGEISIFDTFSIVDLPEGMPEQTMEVLARARVNGRALELREYSAEPPRKHERGERSERPEQGVHGERAERRGNRAERRERGEFGARREHSDRFERADRFERTDRFERSERFEHAERAGRFAASKGKGRARDLASFGFDEPVFVDDAIDFDDQPAPKGPKSKKGKQRPSFDLDARGRKGAMSKKGAKGGFKGGKHGRPHFGGRGF